MPKITMSQLRQHNQKWFSRENRKLFEDIWYKTRIGKKSKKTYLVRATYAWSFRPKQEQYVISEIDQQSMEIQKIVSPFYTNLDDIERWLREH